jgi:hypothetical protein
MRSWLRTQYMWCPLQAVKPEGAGTMALTALAGMWSSADCRAQLSYIYFKKNLNCTKALKNILLS